MSPDRAVRSSASPARDITAVVLTLDEETHLPDCLRSLDWADRILVVDSGSRDATVEIARSCGADVVHHPFVNYSRQRQHALEQVHSRWLLFVDADERVPHALANEVRSVASGGECAGYWIPRHNEFWGHRLRGGGWWPDRQLRLLDTGRAAYDPRREVHEVAELDGPAGVLSAPLIHINYESPAEFRTKQRAYVRLEARRRCARNDRIRPHHFVLQPLREFYRRLVALHGWRDGLLGVYLAIAMGWYELRTLVAVKASSLRRSGP